MPRPMVWSNAPSTEYLGVRVFVQRLKIAIMAAHDSIITSRIKQTRDANWKRQPAPFKEKDLVKLIPKYEGPYLITKSFSNNSFRIQLPAPMRQRGIHDVFHASLLWIHKPNDDQLFPGRMDEQVVGTNEGEWAADKIVAHKGASTNALFEVL
ncbi:hypothetical protein DXG01_003037 [Tephrocybe rancida]|nr:hypothetical protein DXG01_003037 [Tephrocybe rancida]